MNGHGTADRQVVAHWWWSPLVVVPIAIGGLLVARLLPGQLDADEPKLLVALMAIPAVGYLLAAEWRWQQALDELQQRIRLSVYVVALAAIVAVIWPMWILQRAGFLEDIQYIDVIGVAAILGGGIGWLWQRRRFG